MLFWDRTHGIVLGDPIPDETDKESSKESGQLKFELLQTTDGQTWTPLPPANLPPAIEGEGAFAASNTCLAILRVPSALTSKSTPTSRSTPTSMPILTSELRLTSELLLPTVIPSEARNLGFAGATVEERRFSAARAFRERGGFSPRPQHLVRHRRQSCPSLPLSRPRPDLASLQHSHRPRTRLRRNLLHLFPRSAPWSNRRRRLQASRPGRPQLSLHQRRRPNLDSLRNPPPSLLLRCRL